MNKELKAKIIGYCVTVTIAGVVAWRMVWFLDFSVLSWAERYRHLSDAFTVPGLLFLMLYALIWVSTKGALDGIGYAMKNAFAALIPGARAKTPRSYYDYIQLRKERRKPIRQFSPLLVVGGICLIISIIFIFLYYKAL